MKRKLRSPAPGREKAPAFELNQDFLSEFAHAVKTPLLTIRLTLDLISASMPRSAAPETGRNIGVVSDNVNYLSELFGRFLEFSRLGMENCERFKKRINLAEHVRQIVETQRINYEVKNISLVYDCPRKTINVTAEPLLMSQAVINLMENALKFTPEGGRVVVSAVKKAGEVHISVSDNGEGIPPDQQDRLFERYFQVRDCSGKKYSSVGLGLAIVKKIAEIHDGRITLESVPSRGSSFTLILPG